LPNQAENLIHIPEEYIACLFRVEEQVKESNQEDAGGNKEYLPDYTASHPIRSYSAVLP
jgi:hypothetical protein